MKEILKQLREEHFFSQDKVAKELGISRQSYIKYESGEVVPSVEIIKKLSALYEVSYETIIDNKISLINEYVITEDKVKVADSGYSASSDSRPQYIPVYFNTSVFNVIKAKADELKTSIEEMLYSATLNYNPETSDSNFFDDFVPLGSSDCKILRDYHDDDIFGEMADERYHF